MFDDVVQARRVYRQLAAQQRDKAAQETLPNVRRLLERSAEKWEALADAIAPLRNDNRGARQASLGRPGAPCIIHTGHLTVDRGKRRVFAKGIPVRLTPKEFELVELLAIHAGRHVTKQMLMDNIYPGRKIPDAKIIDVHICKLRKKLIEACGDRNLIRTHHGSGYQLHLDAAEAA